MIRGHDAYSSILFDFKEGKPETGDRSNLNSGFHILYSHSIKCRKAAKPYNLPTLNSKT